MSVPMRAIPPDERPRERLVRLGVEQLSDAELLAVLMGTGIRGASVMDLAQRLLAHCEKQQPGYGLQYLLELRGEELKRVIPGIGPVKLGQVLAGLQLGLRAGRKSLLRHELSNPRAVYDYLAPQLTHASQEQFMVILLNAKNRVIDVEKISVGTLTASLVHPREVFRPAIRRSAHAVVLAHNHPSGDPTPSREDRALTQRLIRAGKELGIEVLDHVVVGDGKYISFRERGLADWS
ncbi:MAG: RadC family protein [Mycobacterium leprae]